jgi:hypothetical protein
VTFDATTLGALALALALVALMGGAAATALLRWSRSAAARARMAHAARGEVRAESLVRRAGYHVVARQVRGAWTIRADGEPLAIGLRADLLVAKGGRRYVAEVKTGALAPRLDHAPTRRQLLEYKVAFDVDGVLLVDAESDRVLEIEMDREARDEAHADAQPSSASPWFVFALGALTGGAIVAFLVR